MFDSSIVLLVYIKVLCRFCASIGSYNVIVNPNRMDSIGPIEALYGRPVDDKTWIDSFFLHIYQVGK